MSICIGEVVSVQGIRIQVKANDVSIHDVLFHDGETYEGISIKGYLLIRRGFRDIACKVEGEHIEASKLDNNLDSKSSNSKPLRKIEVKPIGYFEQGMFNEGVKYLPRINDKVYLASDTQISNIINPNNIKKDSIFIGKTINEDLPVLLPWQKLFNTHIGVFGNTGSGKSNTLTKLYTEIFNLKSDFFTNRSKFIIIDFNGEYTRNQITSSDDKYVIKLNTQDDSGNKIHLDQEQFWNSETLSLLFKATDNTQKPFIKRLVRGKNYYTNSEESLRNYLITTFTRVFTSTSQKKEVVGLFIDIMEDIGADDIADRLRRLSWHSIHNLFYYNSYYFNGGENDAAFNSYFQPYLDDLKLPHINFFNELKLRINLQLINDLQNGYAQFEHIQPLLKRAEAFMTSIERVIEVGERNDKNNDHLEKPLQIISLRNCNQDIKKIIPLLLAKQLYESHKIEVDGNTRPQKTLHIIIDEAHNILSAQSIREQESWKDYRLELFEEIIKEGRKFGVFLTLSSQRPSDISPTIMSQLHNFFIHRLVNDRDLALLDSTVNTLDTLSKDMIPHLGKGCCILTGTSFDMPLLIQVDRLALDRQPDSEDIDIEALWDNDSWFNEFR